jgi:opacity protein-like surface antigen
MASGALGYRYKNFRAEAEYIWRRKNSEKIADITKARFKSHSYMFVVYYDFFPDYWFTPFVNAGVGYTHSKFHFRNKTVNASYSSKDNAFTWSLGAGLSAKLTNRWNLDIGYRYYDMGELSNKYKGKNDITNQEIYAGMRYVL